MISTLFDYRNGLSVIGEDEFNEIKQVILEINPIIKKNSVSIINKNIKDGLSKEGWTENFLISVDAKITIPFYKNNIGLCIQTGNISRIYADLLKLQSLFLDNRIAVGIIIVPHKFIAKVLGSNMANYERLTNELTNIFSKVITMPMIIIGFDKEKI